MPNLPLDLTEQAPGDQVRQVPVSRVRPGPNDRTRFDPGAIASLAASIDAHGLAQPITVRPVIGGFEIVAGERRFRAVQQLGWQTVPALIRLLSDAEAAAVMLAENMHRRDLSPLEEAEAFRARMQRFGWSVEEVAQHGQIRVEMVRRRLKLLELGPEAQRLLAAGSIPLGHAELLADVDRNRQMVALRLFHGSRTPSYAEFKRFLGQLRAAQEQELLFAADEFALQLEQQAQQQKRGGAGVRTADWIQLKSGWTTGETLEKYLTALVEAGREDIAEVVGSIYETLVRSNLTSVPAVRNVPEGWLRDE